MGNVGNAIKSMRLRKGITVDELAEKLGKSRATIYRYESSDIDNMPVSILKPLASALGTTPGELMKWPPAKSVTSKTIIPSDDDGPVHELYQYFIRRPREVQDKIIADMKHLDITFHDNLKYLLAQGKSMDDLIKAIGIDISSFLSLIGSPTQSPTPDEATKIAKYFKQDICDMFFKDLSDKSADNSLVKKSTNAEIIEQNEEKFLNDIGPSALRIYEWLGKDFTNYLTIHEQEYIDVFLHKDFERLIKMASDEDIIQSFYDGSDKDYGTNDKFYRAVANLIGKDVIDFKKSYLESSHDIHTSAHRIAEIVAKKMRW